MQNAIFSLNRWQQQQPKTFTTFDNLKRSPVYKNQQWGKLPTLRQEKKQHKIHNKMRKKRIPNIHTSEMTKKSSWTENKKLTHGKKTNKSFLFSDRKVTNLLFLILRMLYKRKRTVDFGAIFLVGFIYRWQAACSCPCSVQSFWYIRSFFLRFVSSRFGLTFSPRWIFLPFSFIYKFVSNFQTALQQWLFHRC